jgi:asparagine synthetase B (glutamine-hydrolysing)
VCRVHKARRRLKGCGVEEEEEGGEENLGKREEGALYTSAARILLVGTGADEQMAGYGRHRTAFEERGMQVGP